MRGSGSSADAGIGVEAEANIEDGASSEAPSTPAITGAACGADEASTQLGPHGRGAEVSTPVHEQPKLNRSVSPLQPFTSSALQPIAPASTHVVDLTVMQTEGGREEDDEGMDKHMMYALSLEDVAMQASWMVPGRMHTALPDGVGDGTSGAEASSGFASIVVQPALTVVAKGANVAQKKKLTGSTMMKKAAGALKIAVRKDAPAIKPTKRGSIDKAMAAGDPANRDVTLASFKRDIVAASGRGPRKSRWSTWCRLHRNWLGDEVPVLPLSVWSLTVVSAQLKEGGYRSPGDYLSTAKARHLREHEWSSRLARQHSVCLRSATRGIGPGKQCAELLLADFVKGALLIKDARGTPFGFTYTGVIAYFFVLREISVVAHAVRFCVT